jgi:hypothetical protein
MKKQILLFIIVCNLLNIQAHEQRKLTRYEKGKDLIERLYSLTMGIVLGGLSYELGSYAYKNYSATTGPRNTTYIDRTLAEIIKIKNKLLNSHEIHSDRDAELHYEQLFIIPATVLSLTCGFYALNAINKALFYDEYYQIQDIEIVSA